MLNLKIWFLLLTSSLMLSGCALIDLIKNPQGGGGDILERTCIRGQIKDQAAVDALNTEEWLSRGNPPVKLRDRIWARECGEVFSAPPDNAVGMKEE